MVAIASPVILFGGSTVSLSTIPAARTVSVQVCPAIALSRGSSTTEVAGLAVPTAKLIPPGHSKSKLVLAPLGTVLKATDSLKLIVIVPVGSLLVVPPAGLVPVTSGAASTLNVHVSFAVIV